MSKWYLVHVDGRVEEKLWTKTPKLADLQAAVDGYVEHVTLDGCTFIWANEEGILRGMPVNYMATRIYQSYYGPEVGIVGPALVEIRRDTKRNASARALLAKGV